MTDREYLELAAKAAGIEIVGLVDDMIAQPDHRAAGVIVRNERGGDSCWNPLTDDGDAFRLAVLLAMNIIIEFDFVDVTARGGAATEYRYELPSPTDPFTATRRAIVRAAAEIGRQMS